METSEIIKRFISSIENPKMQIGGTWEKQLERVRQEKNRKPFPTLTVAQLIAQTKLKNQDIDRENIPQIQKEWIDNYNKLNKFKREQLSINDLKDKVDMSKKDLLVLGSGIAGLTTIGGGLMYENNYRQEQQKIIDSLKQKAAKTPQKQQGGTVDMYGNEIKAPIQHKNIPRSFYDTRRGIINVGEDYKKLPPQEQEELIAHENRHDWQYKNDRSNFAITHDPDYAFNERLQKKPGITETDEIYNNYHDRQQKETNLDLNSFKQNFPQFSFLSNQFLYEKGFSESMYDDKFTLEGEAQHYQKTGQKSFQQGGTISDNEKEFAKSKLI